MEVLFIWYFSAAQDIKPHSHGEKLPVREQIWTACCHDNDCREAPVSVAFLDAEWASVSIAHFKLVKVRRSKVYESENGKSYFCTYFGRIPPNEDNLLCIFYLKPLFN